METDEESDRQPFMIRVSLKNLFGPLHLSGGQAQVQSARRDLRRVLVTITHRHSTGNLRGDNFPRCFLVKFSAASVYYLARTRYWSMTVSTL